MGKRITDLEDSLGKVPVTALTEISKMADYFGKSKISIVVDYVEAVEVSGFKPEIISMKRVHEDIYLTLKYDMRISRKYQKRKAICENILYFAGKNKKYYKVTMLNSMEIDANGNQYDNLMLASCYLYFKYGVEQMPLQNYRNDVNSIRLPETYANINLQAKEFYDGYLEFRNSNQITIIDSKHVHETERGVAL